MNKNRNIDEFFEGSLSVEEAKDFVRWLSSEEGKEELSAAIDEQWLKKTKEDVYPEWDTERLLEQTKKARKGEVFKVVRTSSKRKIPLSGSVNHGVGVLGSRMLRVAIGLVLILGLGYLLMVNTEEEKSFDVNAAPQIVSRSNAAGIKTKLSLPDGSVVYLNSESEVRYPKDFKSDRTITLKSEGYFKVKEDSLHPFSVKSRQFTTVALGTAFNVKAFDEEAVEVTLVSGKVEVSTSEASQSIRLFPGEAASLRKGGKELLKYKSDVAFVTQWMEGVLEFRKTDFKSIFRQLERWYGVDIQVKGQMTNAKGSGKFRDGESLDNVLEVLSYSELFDYKINKDKVTVIFK